MSGLIKQIRGWPSEGKTSFDIHSLLLDEEQMNEVIININFNMPSSIEGSDKEINDELFIVTPSTSSHIAQAVAGSGMWPLLVLEREGELPVNNSEQLVINSPKIRLTVNDSSLTDLVERERLYAVIMVDVLSSGETVKAIAKFLQDHGFIVLQVVSLIDIVDKGGSAYLQSLGFENLYSYIHLTTEEDEQAGDSI